jgi:ankyrin repeat protein
MLGARSAWSTPRRYAEVILAALIFLASCGGPNLKKIARDWYVDDVAAGKPSPHLYWIKNGTQTVVDRHILSHMVSGCVIYETVRPSAASVVFAVESGKTPVPVATSDAFRQWHFSWDGLRRFDLPRTDVNGVTSLGMDAIAISDMCMLAFHQPAFREDWAEKSSLDVTRVKVEQTVFDVHGADSYGDTTLIEAIRKKHVVVVEELLRVGADANAPNNRGVTPLMTAVTHNPDNTQMMQLILAAGVDVNAQDNRGMTALMEAARYGRKDPVALLLARGADPSIRDNQGRTAAAMTSDSRVELNRLLEEAAARRK